MSEYRYTNSHVTQAVLNADASSIVANWQINAPGERWNVNTSGLIDFGTAQRTTLGNTRRFVGNFVLPQWSFLITVAQSAYFYSTINGGLATTPATIKTYNAQRNAWQIYQTTATIQIGQSNNTNDAWLNLLVVSFLPAVIAPAS